MNASQLKRCCSRRNALIIGGIGLVLSAVRSSADEHGIIQPESLDRDGFIRRAFEMRDRAVELGDQAYGAVIVDAGRVIGQSWSRVVIDQDPTAHAEICAIRDACRRQGTRNLSGAMLYSSSRPCPMCSAAAHWAGIGQLIYGANGQDGGAPTLC